MTAAKLCLSRDLQAGEAKVLFDFLNKQRQKFSLPGADPLKLLAEDGKSTHANHAEPTSSVGPAELAAWTATMRVILNLDETITRE
jgi:hypothetical protein